MKPFREVMKNLYICGKQKSCLEFSKQLFYYLNESTSLPKYW